MQDKIKIKGARVNNLKNVIWRYQEKVGGLGLSGSGKSSLALIPCMQRDRGVM